MSDPLGLSVGTTNLVAARVGNQPVTRRSMLTLGQSGGTITGFVERVGDRVPLVTPDGKSYLAEQLLVEALDAMVELGGGPSSDVAIAVPAHWNATTIWAFRGALANSKTLSQTSQPVRVVSDAVAALTALKANPGITADGMVALLDFGGSGTSITLADATAVVRTLRRNRSLSGLLRRPDRPGVAGPRPGEPCRQGRPRRNHGGRVADQAARGVQARQGAAFGRYGDPTRPRYPGLSSRYPDHPGRTAGSDPAAAGRRRCRTRRADRAQRHLDRPAWPHLRSSAAGRVFPLSLSGFPSTPGFRW